jgi:ribosomal protein S6
VGDELINLINENGIRTVNKSDSLLKVIQDRDGNYVAVGKVASNDGYFSDPERSEGTYSVIIKFDKELKIIGEYIFDEGSFINNTEDILSFLEESFDDSFTDVIEDSHGDYIVVGHTEKNNSNAIRQGVIVRFNKNLVMKDYEVVPIDKDGRRTAFNSIIEDKKGYYVVSGFSATPEYAFYFYETFRKIFNSYSDYKTEGFLMKFNDTLELVEKQFDFNIDCLNLLSVIEDKDGNYLTTGYSYNKEIYENRYDSSDELNEGIILKVDSNLNALSYYVYKAKVNKKRDY